MDTRARILSNASRLFAERGFKGTTTRAIGEAAGCNVATIAWHFKDKQGLYDACLSAMYERMLALERPIQLPDDPRERVRTLVRFVFAFMLEHRDHVRLMQRHLLERGRVPELVSSNYTAALLARGAEWMALLQLPPDRDLRLVLLDLNHLVNRYVLSEPEDLALFIDGDDVFEQLAEHLAEVAVTLLLESPPGLSRSRSASASS